MSHNSISRRSITLLGLMLVVAVISGFFISNSNEEKQRIGEHEMVQSENPLWFLAPEEGDVTDVSRNGQILYLAKGADNEGMGGDAITGKDLVVKDIATGVKIVIARNIYGAKFSPDGTMVATYDIASEVKILDLTGKVIEKIGKHGAGPRFSHDGKYLAYYKLADEGEGQDLFEKSPYGLALFDLENKTEKILTRDNDDFEPLGFSLDMSILYFNSSREYQPIKNGVENHIVSLWMIELATGKTTRLTNIDEEEVYRNGPLPMVSSDALWSLDRKIIISETDGEIWRFELLDSGILKESKQIASGDSVGWEVQDESIKLKTAKEGWKVVSVK